MTPEEIKTRMEAASSRLVDLRNELDRKDKLLRAGKDVNGDGAFDDEDVKAVEQARERRDSAQIRVDDLLQKLIVAQAEADGTPIEEIEFEEGEFVEGDLPHEGKRFDADKNGFTTQITTWRNEIKLSLNKMIDSMTSDSDPGPTLSGKDILTIATSALSPIPGPLQTGIGVATMAVDLINKAHNKLMPAQPTLRQLEDKWSDAVDALTDSEAEKLYDQLVKDFISANSMDAGETFIYPTYVKQWDAIIAAFRGGRGLPSKESITRAYMTHVIKQMPDSTWDFDQTSGEVYIYMEFDMDKNDFTFSSGSIDDLTKEVKSGLTVSPDIFGEDKVKMLPVPITFSISGSGWTDGTYCKIHRSKKTSGDTGFQLSAMVNGAETTLEEQGTLFKIFMNRKIYDRVAISQIL